MIWSTIKCWWCEIMHTDHHHQHYREQVNDFDYIVKYSCRKCGCEHEILIDGDFP